MSLTSLIPLTFIGLDKKTRHFSFLAVESLQLASEQVHNYKLASYM